ncbi:hypothetical protein [Actibacterium sp. XHP0104]|uniref:hypothetical protein n=1 Tax=Actibacterium sp. XHP0104 TaxID=2984335 RepID=UPI0021E94701|nr:hypothetical protein [Actibacterium sp. XHP0104]MCV2883059.1 hypothetical protein [Actibacterium sp. XHP0104]
MSAYGELELRPEYTWIQAQSQEREINGYLGVSTITIFEAYTFTGNIISNGQVSRLENASVQLNVTCFTDGSTGCSTPLPIDTPITFGGVFLESPARTIKNGSFCGNYLENSIFQNIISLTDIKNSAEIWEGN